MVNKDILFKYLSHSYLITFPASVIHDLLMVNKDILYAEYFNFLGKNKNKHSFTARLKTHEWACAELQWRSLRLLVLNGVAIYRFWLRSLTGDCWLLCSGAVGSRQEPGRWCRRLIAFCLFLQSSGTAAQTPCRYSGTSGSNFAGSSTTWSLWIQMIDLCILDLNYKSFQKKYAIFEFGKVDSSDEAWWVAPKLTFWCLTSTLFRSSLSSLSPPWL